jgi:hypothetical protein
LAVLFENGDMTYFTESTDYAGVATGQWSQTGGNTFTFDAVLHSVYGGVRNVSGSGTFTEDEFTANSTGNGQLFATPIPSFQHGLDTAKMAGNYDIYDLDDSVVGSANIQNDGKMTGTTNTGCLIDGAFTVPNTNFNQARLNVTISNCSSAASVSGAAVYRDSVSEIVIAAAGSWTGYVWTLKRK